MSKFYSTDRDERDFLGSIGFAGLLERAVEWIRDRLDPEQVFDDDELHDWAVEHDMFSLDWIAENMDPDEVYKNAAKERLHDWAVENDYVHMDGIEAWAVENGYTNTD